MLKKYSDFVNESLELILESDVVYSDKFRKTLAKIDHPIAKALLDTENNLYNSSDLLDFLFLKSDISDIFLFNNECIIIDK